MKCNRPASRDCWLLLRLQSGTAIQAVIAARVRSVRVTLHFALVPSVTGVLPVRRAVSIRTNESPHAPFHSISGGLTAACSCEVEVDKRPIGEWPEGRGRPGPPRAGDCGYI